MADAAKSLLLFVLRKERKDEERLRKKRFDEMEEEYARKNKIEAKLTSEELELREKILIAWIRFYDGPGSHNDPKTCPPERRKGLIETLNIMKEIDLKADLKKMRNLLTPKEYKRFLPIYNYFKKTGKFSIPGFRGE
ncbi:MAG: hypothetical protein NTW67_02465 [Candidatus Woesearchaeota archaeon]|nr:hypothetical protein [Candidatus Woesearchaeota archaeon]